MENTPRQAAAPWEAEEPVLPADRAEKQRDHIRKIIACQRRCIRDESFHMTVQQIACLLLAPEDALIAYGSLKLPCEWGAMYNNLIRSSLVRPEENDQSAEASAENDDDQHLPRNMTRASLAKERDGGQCILTGAGAGRLEVAHTVPFSINNSVTRCSALERTINSVIHLFPYQNHRYRNLLYKRGPGCTDYPWNMLTLSSTLYSVWAEARFGIFWKHSWIDEHDPSITKAKLQIRLFKQDGKDKDGKKTLDSHRLMNIDDDDEFHRMISVVNGIHGENSQVEGLYSGSIFYIRIPTIDAEKMQAMMDFQWACLCIHNMAGGGRPEDLPILCVYPPMELDEWRKWTR